MQENYSDSVMAAYTYKVQLPHPGLLSYSQTWHLIKNQVNLAVHTIKHIRTYKSRQCEKALEGTLQKF